MTSPKPKYEGWLYGLAFLIAIGFRLIQLGATPLTDSEAHLALQSLHLAQGGRPLLAPQPAYLLFTSLIFWITEAANFTARLLPALAGSALVFAPRLFRDRLKPLPALILAFLLAFDPALTALSRQANGTILALTCLLFAWGMWRNGHAIPAGIFAALALLSGPSIWSGFLMLILPLILIQRAKPAITNHQFTNYQFTNYQFPAFLASLLLAGTLFFTVPNGLSAFFASLSAYLQGWTAPSVFTPGRVLFTFLAYEPLGIFLAVLALIRGFRLHSPRVTRLSLWLGLSLLLAVFYRQPGELVWTVIPLLILASQELSRALEIDPAERVEISVVAGAMLILLIYIWFNIANIGLNPYEHFTPTPLLLFNRVVNFPFGPRYVILFGAALILIISAVLVAFGWSPRTARLGATWSFSLFLGVYALAAAWGASGMRLPNSVELWSADQPPLQVDLLVDTVQQASLFSAGHITTQPVTVLSINSPAIEWALRGREVKLVTALDPLNPPPLLITPLMNEPGVPAAYRGQDFTWRQPPAWQSLQNPDWLRWLVYRQLPRETETILLWVRDDLFPDARQNGQP
ncbi:MAG: hypothetical protein Kow0070_18120 [Anaerolineales bacterium]